MVQIPQQDSIYIHRVQEQGTEMCKLLIAKDYKAFSKFTYPPVIVMIGGEEKMIEKMTQQLDQMAIDGYVILNASIVKPLRIVHLKDELQCTLAQNIEMKVPTGREMIHSSLIAISTDKGENWTFIDTQNKDIKKLQVLYPNLSDSLVMLEKKEPEAL